MKIFFYINTLSNGGAERVISVLANQLANKNYSITVITSFRDTWEYTLNQNVRRLSLEDNEENANFLKRNISRTKKLHKIIKIEKPDILISFMPEPNFRALIAIIGLKTKTIISVRNDPNQEYDSALYRLLAKTLYRRADGYVFQTKHAQQWFPKQIQKKSVVILNPVDDTFYLAKGEPGSKKSIVSVGRLENQKNFSMLINAFSVISDEYTDYNLIIYGDGSLRNTLENQIIEAGLKERVILFGQSDNIPDQIKDASVFVLSSDVEGLPNALMEAMALGHSVISTDCAGGGAHALIENGINGLLVPVGNEQAMVEALRKLLSDKNYSRGIGKAAKEKSLSFNANSITEQWLHFFKRLMD